MEATPLSKGRDSGKENQVITGFYDNRSIDDLYRLSL